MPAPPRSLLSAAADRLERLVQDVKQKQFDATGVTAIPAPPPPGLHPEEAWMREYATHTFGGGRSPEPPLSAFLAPLVGRPKRPALSEVARLPLQKRSEQGLGNQGGRNGGSHIGAALGKPAPGRGWLGRLFRHRDN
jgi:hypothetical protein